MRWRIAYAVMWLMTVIAYSLPWARVDDKVYIGWNFTAPFSITYLIGIILGLVVVAVKFRPVTMTVIAGILMILGVTGAILGLSIAGIFGVARAEAGMSLAFLLSLIYTVAGAYIGKKMGVKKAQPASKPS